MLIASLIKNIGYNESESIVGADCTVSDISFDSRNLSHDSLFVAIAGEKADGHNFISTLDPTLITGVVAERIPENVDKNKFKNFIIVPDTRVALSLLATAFFGDPSSRMKVIGVTGTNGKTTIATLIYDMARMTGHRAGLLSTVANYIDGEKHVATHTTPNPIELNRLLKQMADEGCEIVAMEVSSHAAHQHRIDGIKFAGAIFTNLTRDHLDYHGTFAAYRDAKKLFFDNLGNNSFALINGDDKNAAYLVQNSKAKVYTYALKHDADFKCKIIEKLINGTEIRINGFDIFTVFAGVYNAYNLTAVFGAMALLGLDLEQVAVNLSALKPVAGRFQTLQAQNGTIAVIDYAHTPDALENVLKSIKDVKKPSQKIITVVGAGGNRDKGKRPLMAAAAANMSWKTILTSDNPRSEDPMDIINDMKQGIGPDNFDVLINPDRREAIKTAFSIASPGDIILIAGKGHEDYQEINGVRHHFSDFEEVKKIIS